MSDLAFVLAAFGAYIAWRQSQTARLKLKLDLFERRLGIYRAVLQVLRDVTDGGNVSNDVYFGLVQKLAEAQFLFPKPVIAFLEKIVGVARQHRSIGRQIVRAGEIQDAIKVSKLDIEQNEVEIVLEKELASAVEHFRPYLDFKDVRWYYAPD